MSPSIVVHQHKYGVKLPIVAELHAIFDALPVRPPVRPTHPGSPGRGAWPATLRAMGGDRTPLAAWGGRR